MLIPTPEERPDLYDAFDLPERTPGYKSGIAVPVELQRLMDAKARDATEGGEIHYRQLLDAMCKESKEKRDGITKET